MLRCLECVNNESRPDNRDNSDYDKVVQFCRVMNTFVRRSQELFNLEKYLIVDEIIVPYLSHYNTIRQDNPKKPIITVLTLDPSI